jgi:hypothetical protein
MAGETRATIAVQDRARGTITDAIEISLTSPQPPSNSNKLNKLRPIHVVKVSSLQKGFCNYQPDRSSRETHGKLLLQWTESMFCLCVRERTSCRHRSQAHRDKNRS